MKEVDDVVREMAARKTTHEQHMDWVLRTFGGTAYRQELDSEWVSTSPGSPGYEDDEDRAILRARQEISAWEERS